MSLLVLAPASLVSATTDLESIGSALNTARATAAFPTTGLVAAGDDEVSAAVSAVFSAYGEEYQALGAQVSAFHQRFLQALNSAVESYVAAEAANAAPLQAVERDVLSAVNTPAKRYWAVR